MTVPFRMFSEQRSASLRVRLAGLVLVFAAFFIADQFIHYESRFLYWICFWFLAELVLVWLFLRGMEKYQDSPRAMWFVRVVVQLQALVELLLLAWAIYYTGGIISPLIPIILVYLIGDGLTSTPRMIVVHALFAAVLVAGITIGTYYGLVVRYNIGLVPENDLWRNQSYVDGALAIFGALLVLTVLIAVTFSRHTAARERQLGESARQLSVRVEQLNTLRDIGQRLASSLELDQVMDAVGESALRIVKATDVHLYTFDEDTGQFGQGVGVWADGHRGTVIATPRADGLSAYVARTRRPFLIEDAENHFLFQSLQARAWALKAIAGFPIIKAERLIAIMNVAFLEPHEFTRQEEEGLAVLTDQAAIAIDNARLYQQVQRKIQELSALNAVTQSAAQLTDLSSMLNDALGGVLTAVNADGTLVTILDPHKNTLEMAAHRGLSTFVLNEFKSHPLHVGEGFGGEVARTGKPRFVANIKEADRVSRRGGVDQYASIYSVPLRAYDHVIGVLQLVWKEPHQLTATEANLIGSFAPQLAVAIHNSSLYSETKRRAEELATLRSIGLATTSTLNLREQLRLLYENVNQLLRADTFFVGLYDDARDELRVEYVVEEGWFLRPIQVPLAQAGLSGWVIRNQKALMLGDLQLSEELPTPPQHVTRPARSWLGVPLMLKERIVGLISAQSFQPNAFTSEDERFLVAVGQHVALALDNARLFGEAERRTRELTLLNEISRAISASLDLDDVMVRTARALSDQLGYRYVSIYQFEGEQLVCKASVNDVEEASVWDTSQGIIGRVARTGRAALVTNVQLDADYITGHADVVSEICVPIIREGRVLGIVNIEDARLGTLKEDDLVLLSLLCEQLAIASSNASLYREALGRERFATRLGQLGMTITSTLDLVPLIDTLCRESLTLFAVDTAAIYMREVSPGVRSDSRGAPMQSASNSAPIVAEAAGDHAVLACRAAAGWGRAGILGHQVEVDQLGNLLARTLRLARGFVLHDARSSALIPADLRERVQPEACLAVPIVKERDVIGVLALFDRQDAGRFGDPDLARAAIVASQAGLAISNARLFQASQRRTKEQSSLYEIGLAVSSTLDLNEQLRIIYEQIARHFTLVGFDIALRDGQDRLNFALFIDEGKQLDAFSKPLNDAGFAGWVVTSRRPLVIDDIRRQWDSLPVKPGEHGAPHETASYIGIPLMIKAEAIGVMALQRSPVEPFTVDEQRFLFALAQQVAFAVDNARLHQQSQRSAAQQALLYQASRRIAGALDLETLLKAIVDALSQDLGFRGVRVMLVDRELNELRLAAASVDVDRAASSLRYPVGKGLMGLAAQTGKTQLANERDPGQSRASTRESKPMPEIAVPITSGSRSIGVLSLASADDKPFADDDVRMFTAIADQLAVAIENAKLFTSAQERLARINALQNIEVAILTTMNLVDRLDLILEHAVTQMRADLGVIFMRDPQTRELYGLRQRGSRDLGAFREMRFKGGEGAAGWIMDHGEPLYLPDVGKDVRWSYRQDSGHEGVVSYLGVPLRVEDRTIGVIDVATREPRLFTDEEINFFNTLASHAAVAIENARLYEQTRQQLEQLRDTQDRLIETERRAAIGELVAGLAHEINNPLTAIMGHSQLLLETIPAGTYTEGWRGELDTISVAAQRIARIVQEFVKLSHVEGGHGEAANLGEIVQHAVERFQARDDSQDIAVTQDLPPDPLWVRANAQLVDQVLGNILTNALEAMPHGGSIAIHAGLFEANFAYCMVQDSGYGIPPVDLKRVFEPGYTTKVESGVVRGIGLGLYTAERIIKSHGGSIWLESEEGKFTTVTFTLPLQRVERNDAN